MSAMRWNIVRRLFAHLYSVLKILSQADQAKALGEELNWRLDGAMTRAQLFIEDKVSGAGLENSIHMVTLDQAQWLEHQGWSSDPWIFSNDTWIHPNAKGPEQLAKTVVSGMCEQFKHWCGSPPTW